MSVVWYPPDEKPWTWPDDFEPGDRVWVKKWTFNDGGTGQLFYVPGVVVEHPKQKSSSKTFNLMCAWVVVKGLPWLQLLTRNRLTHRGRECMN